MKLRMYECSVCGYQESGNRVPNTWRYFEFRFLDNVYLCVECIPRWLDHMTKCYMAGM